jgi:hypothetical protein
MRHVGTRTAADTGFAVARMLLDLMTVPPAPLPWIFTVPPLTKAGSERIGSDVAGLSPVPT